MHQALLRHAGGRLGRALLAALLLRAFGRLQLADRQRLVRPDVLLLRLSGPEARRVILDKGRLDLVHVIFFVA